MASPERLIPAFESHPASNGASAISRGSENLAFPPVEAANIFRKPGAEAKVQSVSLLPEIADVVTYHASTYGNDAYNAGVNTIEYLRLTGLFWLKTLGALWAFGQAKRFGRFAKRKWNEFTSPYNNY